MLLSWGGKSGNMSLTPNVNCHLIAIPLVILYLFCPFSWGSDCPILCDCLGGIVDCSGKRNVSIPNDIPTWVEELNLSKVPKLKLSIGDLQQLPYLHKLSLNDAGLKQFPNLGPLPTLRRLSLAGNSIHELGEVQLSSFPFLQDIDLSGNKMSALQWLTFANTSIRRLDLRGNAISEIPADWGDDAPTTLLDLRLSRNQIGDEAVANLSQAFANLKVLKALDLSKNDIANIEGLLFRSLPRLRTLKLKKNNIQDLSDGVFFGLNSMANLHLDGNNITTVSNGWLFGLKSLKTLTLSHNNIDTIKPRAWETNTKLAVLDLSHNRLLALKEDSLKGLSNLQELLVSHNFLTHIHKGIFTPMGKLKKLDVSYNELRWSVEDNVGAFEGLNNLLTLSIAFNEIETIHHQAFQPLTSLSTLDLTGNQLRNLPLNPFTQLSFLKKMFLNTSSLVCDCHLTWLPGWLATNSFGSVTAKCGFPANLAGKSIFHLAPGNFSCSIGSHVRIVQWPLNRTALYGHNMTLSCVAAADTDQVLFLWMKDRHLLQPYLQQKHIAEIGGDGRGGSRYNVTSELHIANVSYSHSGSYQCIARSHFGPKYSPPAKVNVYTFPYFTQTPESVEVKVGSVAKLKCAAIGFPTPEISLRKEGKEFPAALDRRLHVLQEENVYYIEPVLLQDDGTYVCTATNEAGILNTTAIISVIESPNFTSPHKHQVTKLGHSAVLECQGSGRPAPFVTWTKDGKTVRSDADHVTVENGQFLLIFEAQVSDAGDYVCELSNPLGTRRREIQLNVLLESQFPAQTGIVIIVVVSCVLLTSCIWLAVIYAIRARKRKPHQASKRNDLYSTTNAQALKSEGIPLTPLLAPPSPPLDPYAPQTNGVQDSSSEHSSGKDSGVGDTHRSSEDLHPGVLPNGADLSANSFSSGTFRRSFVLYPDSPTINSCKDACSTATSLTVVSGGGEEVGGGGGRRARLSSFSGGQGGQQFPYGTPMQQPYTASLRRGSTSRLLAVPSPVTPTISSLPRHSRRNTAARQHTPLHTPTATIGEGRPGFRPITPPLCISGGRQSSSSSQHEDRGKEKKDRDRCHEVWYSSTKDFSAVRESLLPSR